MAKTNRFEVREWVSVLSTHPEFPGYSGTISSWQRVENRILYLIDEKYQLWEEELEKLAHRKIPRVD